MTETIATDRVDEVLAGWRRVHPTLDPDALGLIGRVLILAKSLEASVESALQKHDLSLGQFDILATLRRNTEFRGLTPTQLLQSVVLSSGGMTSRLDKLEAAGLIEREADPTDRRGTIVILTAKGKKKIDAATATRFEEARQSAPDLGDVERQQLEDLLRTWMIQREG
jgi:DNA-binding MarR family transcriptional regulator